MLDFVVLAPDVNSGRMYAGVGSGPLHAAAAGWEGLAADLSASAQAFASVISSTTEGGSWRGVGAAAMTASATPYVGWLHATAAAAGEAAAAVRVAAGAFEQARSATVPPEVVAANRALLASLVASNVLGQNTPAIAATEAHYGQMWAQDVAAMSGYQAAVQAVSQRLAPFTAPPTKAGTATGEPVGGGTAIDPGTSTRPAGPGTATGGGAGPVTPGAGGGGGSMMSMAASMLEEGVMTGASMAMMPLTSMMGGAPTAPADTAAAAAGLGNGPALAGAGAGLTGPVSAGLGGAHPIGGLSVPPSWAAPLAGEAVAGGVPALAGVGVGGANALPAGVAGAPMGGMPMMPMGGAGAPLAAAGAAGAGMPGAGGGGRGWPLDTSRSSVVPRLGVG